MHLFLSEQSAEFLDGDGKTKFFDIDCLDFLLKLIALYAKQSKQTLILKKDIKLLRQDEREKLQIVFLKNIPTNVMS